MNLCREKIVNRSLISDRWTCSSRAHFRGVHESYCATAGARKTLAFRFQLLVNLFILMVQFYHIKSNGEETIDGIIKFDSETYDSSSSES